MKREWTTKATHPGPVIVYVCAHLRSCIIYLTSFPWKPPWLILFTSSLVSDSLRPHGLQHARFPSITNSRSSLKLTSTEAVMLSITSSVVPFSSCLLAHYLPLFSYQDHDTCTLETLPSLCPSQPSMEFQDTSS